MELTTGRLLGRSLTTLIRQYPVFLVPGLIFSIPDALIQYHVVPELSEEIAPWVSVASVLLFNGLLTGAVLFAVVESLRGSRAEVGRSLGIAFRRIVPISLISVIYMAGILLGAMAFLVPGAMLACLWYVAVPATVVERTGVFASLGRSAQLTHGYKMKLFLAALVFFTIQAVAEAAGDLWIERSGYGEAQWMLVTVGLGLTVGLWGSVCVGVAYHDLRVDQEGIDTSDLAAIFD